MDPRSNIGACASADGSTLTARPAVSVVIPAYRAEGTIREALNSVRSQTFADYEIIIVDDASPDNTAEVVDSGIREEQGATSNHPIPQSPSSRLIRLPRNLGPAGARNEGIRLARGQWVAFLDGDDAWLPWRLALQIEAVRANPDAVLVCGALSLFDAPVPAAPTADQARAALRGVAIEEFIDENPVPTSTVLVRADAVRGAGGFDERFRGPEDIDLWMRMAAAGPVLKIECPLVRYRERPGSLSMDQDHFLPQIIAVYDKAFGPGGVLESRRVFRRRAIASRYVSAAWSLLVCGRRGRALGWLLRSWLIWPQRLRVEQRRPAWRLILLARILLNRR